MKALALGLLLAASAGACAERRPETSIWPGDDPHLFHADRTSRFWIEVRSVADDPVRLRRLSTIALKPSSALAESSPQFVDAVARLMETTLVEEHGLRIADPQKANVVLSFLFTTVHGESTIALWNGVPVEVFTHRVDLSLRTRKGKRLWGCVTSWHEGGKNKVASDDESWLFILEQMVAASLRRFGDTGEFTEELQNLYGISSVD